MSEKLNKSTAALERWANPEFKEKAIEAMRQKNAGRNEEICKMAREGKNIIEIMQAFDLTRHHVNRILRQNKIEPLRPPRQVKTKNITKNIVIQKHEPETIEHTEIMPKFKTGDCVILKSGSSLMTVKSTDDQNNVLCCWFNNSDIKEYAFHCDLLKLHIEQ